MLSFRADQDRYNAGHMIEAALAHSDLYRNVDIDAAADKLCDTNIMIRTGYLVQS